MSDKKDKWTIDCDTRFSKETSVHTIEFDKNSKPLPQDEIKATRTIIVPDPIMPHQQKLHIVPD